MNELPIASNEKINVSILAFNDLHGHLEPPSLSVRERIDGNLTEVPAGGAAYLAAAIQHHKKLNPLNAVVSAGDMIGATPSFLPFSWTSPPSKRSMPWASISMQSVIMNLTKARPN